MKHTLTDDAKFEIETIASNNGVEVYEEYSGRAMYGDTCFGLVFDMDSDIDAFRFGMFVAESFKELELDDDLAAFECNRSASDSMGLGMIIYWPRIKWEDNDKTC